MPRGVYTTQQTSKAPKAAFLASLVMVLGGFAGMAQGDENLAVWAFFLGIFGMCAAKLWGWWAHG